MKISSKCLTSSKILKEIKHPKVIFSGIQPTSLPHLGNYFGAIKNWVTLQNNENRNINDEMKTTILYSIVDLHALTTPNPIQAKQLRKNTLDITAALLASGIDTNRSILYCQSSVSGHNQLAWILSCHASIGALGRMTQWKSKRQQLAENSQDESRDDLPWTSGATDLGLFTYPVLQAADILLYKSTHVPVGEDQRQHLELTRAIASKFNRTYSSTIFPLPKDIYTPGSKIQSFTNPLTKMSKSDPNVNSRIDFNDDASAIAKKIKRALTDSEATISYDPINRPGLSNLIQLMALVRDSSTDDVVSNYQGMDRAISKFKTDLSDSLIAYFEPLQKEFVKLRADEKYLIDVLKKGALKANEIASPNLEQVYKQVGILRFN